MAYFAVLQINSPQSYTAQRSLFAVSPAISYDDKLTEVQKLKGGQKLTIDTKISGVPTPTVTWSHDGQPLQPDEQVSIDTSSTQSKLVISDISAQRSGKYKIVAENEVGFADAEFVFEVKGKHVIHK